jgi:hypothetical protein
MRTTLGSKDGVFHRSLSKNSIMKIFIVYLIYYFSNTSNCSMSAIDFYCSVDKVEGADGKTRVVVTFVGKYLPYTEQVCYFFRVFLICSVRLV